MSTRVHRVLVEDLEGGEVHLLGPEAHHLANVLRVKPGAAVEAFDGKGSVARGAVMSVERGSVTLQLEQPAPSQVESPLRLTAAVALLKSDKLSDVVRQCTELGVASFELVITQHSDVTAISAARLTRLRRVAEEAARQSGRATVPGVEEPIPLAELAWQGAALVAHPRAERSLAELLPGGADTRPDHVTLITGPEGGLSEAEVRDLVQAGAEAIRFGPRTLRAETAPVALAAALLLPGGW